MDEQALTARRPAAALLAAAAASALLLGAGQAPAAPRNVVLFVPDGLRSELVAPETTPNLAAFAAAGVRFANSHAVYPTVTMVNAAAFATGHQPGDTGVYAGSVYVGEPVAAGGGSVVPSLEDDPTLAELDARYNGLVGEQTLVASAIEAGYSTAVVGKYGPVALQVPARLRERTVLIDDRTGRPGGIAVPAAIASRMARSGLAVLAPGRGDNGDAGNLRERGTRSTNAGQQTWFAAVTTRAILPELKSRHKPFLLIYWSRDPDGTQHNHGDSHRSLEPGTTGPTVMAAVRDADRAFGELLESIDALGLRDSTDIIVASDHGFSTITLDSATSAAARQSYRGVAPKQLPHGFLALDLGEALGLPVREADGERAVLAAGSHPEEGSALLGHDPDRPVAVVAANGGTDAIYLPGDAAAALAARIVEYLLGQDYVGGLFVDDRFGTIPGTLPLSAIGLSGAARTPRPAIVVSFRSASIGCPNVLLCTALVADTPLLPGQGAHGSLGRADTANFIAAAGPGFRRGYVDLMPASNVDVGRTMAALLGLRVGTRGRATGRVLSESLAGGSEAPFTRETVRGVATAAGLATEIVLQRVGETRYVTAGGISGRAVGLAVPER